jgi:hypothetical protein
MSADIHDYVQRLELLMDKALNSAPADHGDHLDRFETAMWATLSNLLESRELSGTAEGLRFERDIRERWQGKRAVFEAARAATANEGGDFRPLPDVASQAPVAAAASSAAMRPPAAARGGYSLRSVAMAAGAAGIVVGIILGAAFLGGGAEAGTVSPGPIDRMLAAVGLSSEPADQTTELASANRLGSPLLRVIPEGVFAHAPSRLRLPTDGKSELSIAFGLLPGSFDNGGATDGVCFFVRNRSSGERLFGRCLEPFTNAVDRGVARARVRIPSGVNEIELVTTCLQECSWDRSYWASAILVR